MFNSSCTAPYNLREIKFCSVLFYCHHKSRDGVTGADPGIWFKQYLLISWKHGIQNNVQWYIGSDGKRNACMKVIS